MTRVAGVVWWAARILFALNWLYNAIPAKWLPSWFSGEFVRRVSYFASDNPWPVPHAVLTQVVLTHSAIFAVLSTVGESAAAILLLMPVTVRIAGAISLLLGTAYSLSMDWVNLGYSMHNGTFAALGLVFLLVGARPPMLQQRALALSLALAALLALGLTWPLGRNWEGWIPAIPWGVTAVGLLLAGVAALTSDRSVPVADLAASA